MMLFSVPMTVHRSQDNYPDTGGVRDPTKETLERPTVTRP